jgi:hypothetical protein
MLAPLSLLASAFLALPAYQAAHDKAVPPSSPFPHVAVVMRIDAKAGTLEYIALVPKIEERFPPMRFRPNDDPLNAMLIYGQVNRKTTLARAKFYDAASKPMSTEEAARKLKAGTLFFVAADGHPPSPAFVELIHANAVVLVDVDNIALERLRFELRNPNEK